jgi:hypothetical protein
LPKVTLALKDAESNYPITDQQVLVSVQQDKWGEGFKEIYRSRPSPSDGTVSYEATSVTKYRIVADGSAYDANEKLIDTGWNFIAPVTETIFLRRKLIPTPDIDVNHYLRDVGLAQSVPLLIFIIGIAIIVGGIAYAISKVGWLIPKRKAKEKTEAK